MDYIAVFILSIVSFFVGALWYSPLLFGNTWVELVNLKTAKPSSTLFMGQYILGLIMIAVLALVVDWSGADSIGGGLFVAFVVWLGFVATSSFSSVLWLKKSLVLSMIESGYYLVIFLISGAVLV